MRRWQEDEASRQINVVEKVIDYVLGSGNHARSFVSRGAAGRLTALPVAWYAENGGYWAMAPGYDRPDHADLRREVASDCLFCHNGYPDASPARDIAEGIDCQRCHGPGRAHVEAARAGAAGTRIRAAIVNPKRLEHQRQMDVCLQCHLQSTSRRLPYAIRRFGRDAYSFRPGERLSDYMLHFALAPEAGPDETFEVVHAGSRFMESSCYQRSAGRLTCTTCHDPHRPSGDTVARQKYGQVCRSCHEGVRHTSEVSGDCVGCHMPKRRTDDAVHVVMTDHRITRTPVRGDLLTPRKEMHESDERAQLGRVVPLYPNRLTGPDELYVAVAQVREAANLTEGITWLQRAIARYRPSRPEFLHELGEALRSAGRPREAVKAYREAVDRWPQFAPAWRGLGLSNLGSGDARVGLTALERAVALDPLNLEALNALGAEYQKANRMQESVSMLRRAIAAHPDAPEPQLNLAVAYLSLNDSARAATALREAIRLRPDFAAAHNNLAILLDRQGQALEAARHFENALRLQAGYSEAHTNYGLHLARRKEWTRARQHLSEAARLAPSAPAFANLGTVLARIGDPAGARDQYRRALELDATFEPARLNLARTLISQGNRHEAAQHLRKLTSSNSSEIRNAADYLLKLIESAAN